MQHELCGAEEVQRMWEAAGLSASHSFAISCQDRFRGNLSQFMQHYTLRFLSPVIVQEDYVGRGLAIVMLSS